MRATTLITTLLYACAYAIPFGVLQQTPRIVPGLPEMHGLTPREFEQTVGRVQFIGELGTLAGRMLFAFLVVRIMSQRRLLRVFLVPGVIVFSSVYFYAATHSLVLLQYGIFVAALCMNGPLSFWWNYWPRVYPVHVRGTGEGFAHNVGGRMVGTFAAVVTTAACCADARRRRRPPARLRGRNCRGRRLHGLVDRQCLVARAGGAIGCRIEPNDKRPWIRSLHAYRICWTTRARKRRRD